MTATQTTAQVSSALGTVEKTIMPTTAKFYIGLIIALGFSLIAECLLFQAQFPDLPRYFSLLAAGGSRLRP